MNKILPGLALVAACTAASAQSSVTLFGSVDTRVAHGQGSISSKTQLASSGASANKIGLRGTEDLGGGLSASFWFEAAYASDNGTGAATDVNNQGLGSSPPGTQGLVFNRRSTVSLAGRAGELRLGRDFTPILWSQAIYDPFLYLGVGITQIATNVGGPTGVRASNSISYFTPNTLGGFYGQLMHFRGENPSGTPTSGDGTGTGFRGGYGSGPLDVSVAVQKTTYASGDIKSANIGGSYDFGVLKAVVLAQRDEVVNRVTGKGWMVAGRAPVGVGEVKLSLSSYKGTLASASRETDKISLGYVHNLSKRTAVYGTYARLRNKGGATEGLNGGSTAANKGASGYDIGIRHVF